MFVQNVRLAGITLKKESEMKLWKSKCCRYPVYMSLTDECTYHYRCVHCGQPCDVEEMEVTIEEAPDDQKRDSEAGR